MVCTHLKELYLLCEENDLRLAGSELIRVVCRQCGEIETCPSMLMDEYDARHSGDSPSPDTEESKPVTEK